MVAKLDRNLAHFASIVERDLGVAINIYPAPVPRVGSEGAWSHSPVASSLRESSW